MSSSRSAAALACALSALLLAAPCLAEGSGAGPREVVRIGVFDLAPFMMAAEGGSVSGVAADFWREIIAPAMGVDVEISGPYPIPRLEIMLEAGEIDVIPYITKIPAREERFLYPSMELMRISACIVVRRDSPLARVEKPSDLFDMRLGFIASAYIPPFVQHERIKLELVTTTDFRKNNYAKLMAGRVDALLDINYVSLLYDMRQRGYLETIRAMPIPADQVPIYCLFARSARGRQLMARFESALSKAPRGSFSDITARYVREGR